MIKINIKIISNLMLMMMIKLSKDFFYFYAVGVADTGAGTPVASDTAAVCAGL
jgi:hypothetical protein